MLGPFFTPATFLKFTSSTTFLKFTSSTTFLKFTGSTTFLKFTSSAPFSPQQLFLNLLLTPRGNYIILYKKEDIYAKTIKLQHHSRALHQAI